MLCPSGLTFINGKRYCSFLGRGWRRLRNETRRHLGGRTERSRLLFYFFFTGRKHMKQKMEIRNGRLSRYNISGNLCMSLAHYNAFTASAAAAAENTTQMFIYFRRIPCPFVSLSLCLSWGNLAQLERQQRRLGISLSLIANVAAAGLPPSRTAWQSGRFSKRKTREVLYM